MRNIARRSALGVVQAALLVALASSAAALLLWAGGSNGFQVIDTSRLPLGLGQQDWNAVPHETVTVDGRAGIATVAAAQREIGGGISEVTEGDGSSEFYGAESNVGLWGLSDSQRFAWSGVRILPLVGLTALWWLLLNIVSSVRQGRGFDDGVASRITWVGVLVMFGVPATQGLRWLVARWLVEDSTAGRIADVRAVEISLAPVAIGLVILVVGYAWRQAVGMREDLAGLV